MSDTFKLRAQDVATLQLLSLLSLVYLLIGYDIVLFFKNYNIVKMKYFGNLLPAAI